MAHKQVLFRSAAREKILRGRLSWRMPCASRLGPKSKSVLIQKKLGVPLVCDDGVTIAKEFDLKDPEENLGAQMLRQAAEKTGENVGDGTSTSTILAHAFLPTACETSWPEPVRLISNAALIVPPRPPLRRSRLCRGRYASGSRRRRLPPSRLTTTRSSATS